MVTHFLKMCDAGPSPVSSSHSTFHNAISSHTLTHVTIHPTSTISGSSSVSNANAIQNNNSSSGMGRNAPVLPSSDVPNQSVSSESSMGTTSTRINNNQQSHGDGSISSNSSSSSS